MNVALALMSLCLAVASSSKCDMSAPLPKPTSMETVKKATGVWYETVTSNDYISAQFICGTASRQQMNSESTRGSVFITKYYSKASPRSFNFHYRIAEDGYIEQVNIGYQEILAHDFDQNGKLNTQALQEDYDMSLQPEKYSLIGDGTCYLAYLKCTSTGWTVWIHTPQKVLTTAELLFIHNELEKHGIHTQLRLNKCANINPT